MLKANTLWPLSRDFKKLAGRYLLVGITAYLIEMGVLYFFRQVLHLGPLLSVAVSFWVGFAAAFVMQKLITFENYARSASTITKQLGGYGLLVLWNYGFTLLAVHAFSRLTSVFVIRTLAIAVITSWNFAIYKHLFGKSV